MVSVGVVVAGVVISLTGWTIVDPLLSLAIAVVILVSTWKLLSESLRLSLDGTPEGIDLDEVLRAGKRAPRGGRAPSARLGAEYDGDCPHGTRRSGRLVAGGNGKGTNQGAAQSHGNRPQHAGTGKRPDALPQHVLRLSNPFRALHPYTYIYRMELAGDVGDVGDGARCPRRLW